MAFIFIQGVWAQNSPTYFKYSSNKKSYQRSKMKKLSDGSFLLIDSYNGEPTASNSPGNLSILKIDQNQNLIWSKTIEYFLLTDGQDILPTDDNGDGIEDGFIVLGNFLDINTGLMKLILIKFSASGSSTPIINWEKMYSYNNNILLGCAITEGLNNENAIFVSAKTMYQVGQIENFNVLLMKINTLNGNILSQNHLTNPTDSYKIDGTDVLTDHTNSQVILTTSEKNQPNVHFFEFDNNCNLLSSNKFHIGQNAEGVTICNAILSSDNYVYAVGEFTKSIIHPFEWDQLIIKFDPLTNAIVWSKRYNAFNNASGNNYYAECLYSISELENGNFAAVGDIREVANAMSVDKDDIFMEISPSGNLLFGNIWELGYPLSLGLNESFDAVIANSNQEFIVAGSQNSDFYIYKVGPAGTPRGGCGTYTTYNHTITESNSVSHPSYLYSTPIIASSFSSYWFDNTSVETSCTVSQCIDNFEINGPNQVCIAQFPVILTASGVSGSVLWYDNNNVLLSNGMTCSVNSAGTYYAIGIDANSGCSFYEEFELTLSTDYFSITSKNDRDNTGNDIITDDAGNIYVTGTFASNSTFKSIAGNYTAQNPSLKTTLYVAKYDVCGNLVWINHSTKGESKGMSIAIDKNRGIIFATGEYASATSAGIKLFSTGVVPPGTTLPSTINYGTNLAGSSFMLALDMNNGTVLTFNEGLLSNVKINAIEAVPNSSTATDIYVGGYQIVSSTSEKTYLRKYIHGTTFMTSTLKLSTSNNPQARINDIAATADRVVATGYYTNLATPANPNFSLSTTNFLNTVGAKEAFKFEYSTSLGGPISSSVVNLVQLGISAGKSAEGTGIVITGGIIYVTGNYTGNVLTGSANGFGTGYTLSGSSTYNSVFVYRLANGPYGNSSNKYYSLNGNAYSTGITADLSHVYVCGNWGRGTLNSDVYDQSSGGYLNVNHSGTSGTRIFVSGIAQNQGNVGNWINASVDQTNAIHSATRIATNGSFTYLTGGYKGSLSHNSGTPYYSTITSSGAKSMCILRNKVSNGEFRNALEDDVEEGENSEVLIDSDNKFEIKVYPNPSKGEFNLSINSEELNLVNVSIYDVTGRMIIKQSVNNGVHNFNISEYPKGIYIMVIQGNEKVSTHKLIIE